MVKPCNVLIPDGDSTWALSVIQCLSQVDCYRLFVLSNKKRTPTKYSRYVSYYNYYERPDDHTWLDIINSEIEANHISVVVPIAEHEIAFFIKFQHLISKTAKVTDLPDLEAFEIAIHKNRLGAFCKSHDIPHPRSFYITSESERLDTLLKVHFPVLIKPLHEKGGDGIKRIDAKSEFPTQFNEPLFVQEYIEGYDIDCSVLCLNGEVLVHTIQKGNLPGSTTYAPQLGFDFLNDEILLCIVRDVMSKLNWSGVAHLDLRYDSIAKNYKLIEINARFWGSVQASKAAGINFPYILIQQTLGAPIDDQIYKPTSYMRLKGVILTLKKQPTFIFKRHYLLNNTEVKTFLRDPKPTFYRFKEWLMRSF